MILYRKNDTIIRITISSIYSKKDLNLIKKGIVSGEKMRISGNYNYDYAHSFFLQKGFLTQTAILVVIYLVT